MSELNAEGEVLGVGNACCCRLLGVPPLLSRKPFMTVAVPAGGISECGDASEGNTATEPKMF